MWREFKPAIRFVGVFLGIYLVGNFLYGVYIHSLGSKPDVFTRAASHQSSWVLNFLGGQVEEVSKADKASIGWLNNGKLVLNVFEGCNGVNVIVVFIAFVVSFGGDWRTMLLFILLGIFIINIINVIRLALLYWVATEYQMYFYLVHKYLFTAIIYAVVFFLWVVWIRMLKNAEQKHS